MTRTMSIDALALVVSLLYSCSLSGHVEAFATSSRARKPFAFVSTAPPRVPKLKSGSLGARRSLALLAGPDYAAGSAEEYLDAMEARLDFLASQLSDLSNKAIEITVMDDHNSMSQIAAQTSLNMDAASAAAPNVAAGSIAGGTAVGAGFMSQGQPSVDDQWSSTSQALSGHVPHVATVAATSGTAVAATTQFVGDSASSAPPQVVTESAASTVVETFANSPPPPPVQPEAPAKMMSDMFEQATQVAQAAPPSPPTPPVAAAVVENNPFMEAMDALQEVAQNAKDSFATQLDLAGRSYETVTETTKAVVEAAKPVMANEAAANVMATKTAAVAAAVASAPPAPSVDTAALMDSLSSRFSGGFSQGMSLTFSEIGNRFASVSAKAAEVTATEASKLASTVAENVISTEKQLVAEAASKIQSAADNNLVEIGSAVMAGLAKMGKILLVLLNLILEAAFDTSLPEIISNAQVTAQGVVDSAMEAITSTLSEIGSRSIADAAVSFANLMLLVGKVLFKVLNGIVAIITGSDVTEWSRVVGSTMTAEASKLGDAAMDYVHHLSEMSVTQLVAVIESFANSAGNTMVTVVGTALDTM